ncbi:MAG: FAD-binding oxidoreductase [Candidatus Peribacteraceae bacterium]|jgi:NAD(P)H-flavin reductase
MATPRCPITCTYNEPIAPNVHILRFTKPEDFTFIPGQFVLFFIPDVADPKVVQPRAYSIASAPEEEDLLFVVRIKPNGHAGKWFSTVLKEGTTVEMQGPMGNFLIDPQNTKDILIIATGVGISPFRSQIRSALSSGDTRRIDLIWCTYNEKDIFWDDDFKSLEKQYPNFFFHMMLSEPSAEWKGPTGRVQKLIPTIEHLNEKQIYICGNPAMTSDVKRLCLEEWGFAKEDVHIEGYI